MLIWAAERVEKGLFPFFFSTAQNTTLPAWVGVILIAARKKNFHQIWRVGMCWHFLKHVYTVQSTAIEFLTFQNCGSSALFVSNAEIVTPPSDLRKFRQSAKSHSWVSRNHVKSVVIKASKQMTRSNPLGKCFDFNHVNMQRSHRVHPVR